MTHKNHLATQKQIQERWNFFFVDLFEASDDDEDKEEPSPGKVNSTSDAEEEEAEVDISDDNSGLISCYQRCHPTVNTPASSSAPNLEIYICLLGSGLA